LLSKANWHNRFCMLYKQACTIRGRVHGIGIKLALTFSGTAITIYKVLEEEMSIFWEIIVSVILSQKLYMCTCPIPNVFRDRAISLLSSKIVDKKEISCTVSNTGIYCSSDKVGTVYLVEYIFENSTVNINALCNSCEDMACCSSVQ
jgi:hypothetical protein